MIGSDIMFIERDVRGCGSPSGETPSSARLGVMVDDIIGHQLVRGFALPSHSMSGSKLFEMVKFSLVLNEPC